MMLRLLLLTLSTAVLAAGLNCSRPFNDIGGRCIFIDPWELGTMSEIRDFCKAYGGDLIWFDNDTDCDFYRDLLTHIHENSLNERDYWMGITDEGHNEVWKYLRNNQVVRDGPPYWDTGFPTTSTTENCAILAMTRGYYWEEVACDSTYSTICRKT
uniref:CTL-6 n=2 Tax=Portunus trituberculatus TaxID=210409 RepID=A0A977SQG0_PORTR|nr:CTL-6 [Portunus trituberculatus]